MHNSRPVGAAARHRYRVWILGFSVLALGVLGGATQLVGATARAQGAAPQVFISEFPLPQGSAGPRGITRGPDGNLWFTEQGGNNIGRITPAGTITEFPLAVANSQPEDIVAGPDGNLWFTESAGNKIGRITPAGIITEFPLPTPTSQPQQIISGPDGNLWFTTWRAGIGRVTVQGTFDFPVPSPCADGPLYGITVGPDNNIWFSEPTRDRIGGSTVQGSCTEFDLAAGSQPYGITGGAADGNLWFAEYGTNKIGRMTPQGTISEFPVLTANSGVQHIAAGLGGNLWFTESGAGGNALNLIAQITVDGAITEYPTHLPFSSPYGIVEGPDGNMWFTETTGDAIGRLSLTAPTPTNTPTATPTASATPSGGTPPPPAAGLIAGGPGNQQNADVDNEVVVWEDDSAGTWDVRARDLRTGQNFPIYAGAADQRLPAISGNLVVWQDNRAGNWDIYGARFSGDQAGPAFPIATGPSDETNPAVSGNLVVWQVNNGGRWDIMGQDLSGGPVRVLSAGATTSANPAVDGTLVVWQSTTPTATLKLPATPGQWDIQGIDFRAGGIFAVTTTSGDHTNPAISGNLVVWQELTPAGGSGPRGLGRWSIEGLDLSTRANFTVTNAPGDQTDPSISDGVAVYLGLAPDSGPVMPQGCGSDGRRRAVRGTGARSGGSDDTPITAYGCTARNPRTRHGRTVWDQDPSGADAQADVYGNVCVSGFADVHPADYFIAPVQALTCAGAISGYGDGTFRPYNDTTRGQLTKIIVAGEGWALDTTGGPHFSDVPTSNPFYAYIETAYNHGIISGYGDGSFRWGANVTRAQLTKIIVGAQGWAINTSGGPHFNDVPTSNPFYAVIETAFNHGIISGYGDGNFRWGANATRGQIAKIAWGALTQP